MMTSDLGEDGEIVWVLATPSLDDPDGWEFGGVFTSLAKARDAAQDEEDEIWLERLNVVLPRESTFGEYREWPKLNVYQLSADGPFYSTVGNQVWSDEAGDWVDL